MRTLNAREHRCAVVPVDLGIDERCTTRELTLRADTVVYTTSQSSYHTKLAQPMCELPHTPEPRARFRIGSSKGGRIYEAAHHCFRDGPG